MSVVEFTRRDHLITYNIKLIALLPYKYSVTRTDNTTRFIALR